MALSLQISLLFLLPIHQVMLGEIFPFDASLDRWWLLGGSSLIGFVISSIMLLKAFQYIGPRLSMLIGSFTPVFGALLAWIVLGQALPSRAVAGIGLVILGVVWVIAGGARYRQQLDAADYRRGLILAIGASFGQGVSYVFMSEGVAGGFHAMSAGLIRTLIGVLILWLYLIATGRLTENLSLVFREPRALSVLALASLTGPVIGTTLILLSLQYTSVGISSTLTGTTPILLIPISYLIFKEAITWQAVAGTEVAIAGVALLFAV